MLSTIAILLGINLFLAIGDVVAKIAAESNYEIRPTAIALGLWVTACVLWLPAMRLPGFTRLIALADAIGLVLIAIGGYFFLGERLSSREIAGVASALVAMALLAGK